MTACSTATATLPLECYARVVCPARTRELLLMARKSVQVGVSRAHEKQREKRRVVAIKNFGAAVEAWVANALLADSTHPMSKHIIDRNILPIFRNRLLTEIRADGLAGLV